MLINLLPLAPGDVRVTLLGLYCHNTAAVLTPAACGTKAQQALIPHLRWTFVSGCDESPSEKGLPDNRLRPVMSHQICCGNGVAIQVVTDCCLPTSVHLT